MKSHINEIKEKINLSDFEIITEEQDLELIMKVKLSNVLPTVIRVKFIPSVKDNKLIFKITSSTIGIINIPKRKFMNILRDLKSEKLEIDKKQSTLIINTQLPNHLLINSIATDAN